MRNFETFRTEDQLLRRIDYLRQAGFKDSELEVLSSKRIKGYDYIDYEDINQRPAEPTITDRIAAFFTGDDPEDRYLDRYDFDETTRLDALNAIGNGYYLLYINRDDYYEDPKYIEGRADYLEDDIRTRDDLDNQDKIRLHEERLRVNKDTVETGAVEINKEVVTEDQEIEVPVDREKVTIERRKVDEKVPDDQGFMVDEGESIRIPIHEEKLSVDKENVVTEEILIKKEVVQDTERVSDKVRKEKVDIQEDYDKKDYDLDDSL